MPQKQNQEPLAGGLLAGVLQAGCAVDIREALKNQAALRLRRQRQVERVCRIPRLVDELLSEIGRHHGIEDDVAARLDRYAAVDHDLLAALGADRFPASPMRVVGGGQ